jgi:2,3-bisphosphoglycerate-independent phosphoglycerate mutase
LRTSLTIFNSASEAYYLVVMKAVLIVGDGMADRPLKELDGKTPLEAADTPALDEIARLGECGIMDTISPGRPPGSDVANLALLGYDPFICYRGRGALEALGAGLDVREDDVAFRGNFATADEKDIIVDRRAGRVDGKIFEKYLTDIALPSHPEVKAIVRPSVEHRVAIVLKGERLSWKIGDSDPHRDEAPAKRVEPLDESPEAKRTAEITNELLEVLKERLRECPINQRRIEEGLKPANIILVRGAGAPPQVKPLKELYSVRGACVAVNALVSGVCRSAGLDILEVPGGTGGVDTDTIAKARVVEEKTQGYDLVYLHVKGTDNASHDGDIESKIKMIEKIDRMARHLLDHLDVDETYIAVTADHTTSLRERDHRGDPVPLAIAGPDVRRDEVTTYGERSCAMGGIGRIRGVDLMPILMNYLGKVPLYGS